MYSRSSVSSWYTWSARISLVTTKTNHTSNTSLSRIHHTHTPMISTDYTYSLHTKDNLINYAPKQVWNSSVRNYFDSCDVQLCLRVLGVRIVQAIRHYQWNQGAQGLPCSQFHLVCPVQVVIKILIQLTYLIKQLIRNIFGSLTSSPFCPLLPSIPEGPTSP